MPKVIDMKKKSIAQILDPGNVATASGYTWNTSPGPADKLKIRTQNISNIMFYDKN